MTEISQCAYNPRNNPVNAFTIAGIIHLAGPTIELSPTNRYEIPVVFGIMSG